jgi:nucleoid-associated protein YgaU
LYRIARNLLGSGPRWGEIFALNRDIITNPHLIHIGWQLRVPNA